MVKTSRFSGLKKIVVCGVISPIRGKVYHHYGYRSFNAQDMQEVLRQVRKAMGDKKVAIFWDNARIHRANMVRELASSPEIDIELVWNVPYRPDLNGIEVSSDPFALLIFFFPRFTGVDSRDSIRQQWTTSRHGIIPGTSSLL